MTKSKTVLIVTPSQSLNSELNLFFKNAGFAPLVSMQGIAACRIIETTDLCAVVVTHKVEGMRGIQVRRMERLLFSLLPTKPAPTKPKCPV
jgi:DNA-binding response OmpR family regulator